MRLAIGGNNYSITARHIKKDETGKALITVEVANDGERYMVSYPNNPKIYFVGKSKARRMWAAS